MIDQKRNFHCFSLKLNGFMTIPTYCLQNVKVPVANINDKKKACADVNKLNEQVKEQEKSQGKGKGKRKASISDAQDVLKARVFENEVAGCWNKDPIHFWVIISWRPFTNRDINTNP